MKIYPLLDSQDMELVTLDFHRVLDEAYRDLDLPFHYEGGIRLSGNLSIDKRRQENFWVESSEPLVLESGAMYFVLSQLSRIAYRARKGINHLRIDYRENRTGRRFAAEF